MAATQASASQLPGSLALAEYLSLVRTHHPTLRAMQLRQRMEQADVKTASTWANPSLHYSSKFDERELGIEQPLPIFGQIGMRTEAARLAAASGAAERAAQAQEILGQAAQRFAQLLVEQQKLAARQQAMAHLEQAAKVVQGQIELGARSRYDGARMELQRAQFQVQLEQQQAQTQAARAALAELLAVPSWSPQAVGSLLPAQAAAQESNLEALWLQAQPRLPALQAAHARVVQAEQFTRQQAREALPTPTVGVTRVRGRQDSYGYNQVGVSIELPLFDRKQGAIERAQLEYTQALLEEDTAQQLARQQLQQALNQRDLLRRALRNFESRGLSQLAPLRQMAQDSYRLGQSSILEWLDAMESVSTHEQEYLDLTLQAWQAQWALDAARGQLPLADCLPAACL
ncbi:TolC family protein [Comamonas endophytica]|uniref:TolC family protein n=1 Tax=Comamonas endophytica TaxID=2949090 RepID=A0ABY6GBS3_9BURK|nr:TolC family protein [Acidovorax sp. 5MLIR]MCD2512224.1 TolC family protein [Acidovorax sp. D4N7]UYG51992.1 TolC family protein [Acidovorax sp. 5MLIR]